MTEDDDRDVDRTSERDADDPDGGARGRSNDRSDDSTDHPDDGTDHPDDRLADRTGRSDDSTDHPDDLLADRTGRSDDSTDHPDDRLADRTGRSDDSTDHPDDRLADRTGRSDDSTGRPAESGDAGEGSFTFVDDAVTVGETATPESGRSGETSETATEGADVTRRDDERRRAGSDDPTLGADAGRSDRSDAGGPDAPLADLARDVSRRRSERDREPEADDGSDLFEEVDVGDVDTDSLWENLADADHERPPGAVDVATDVIDVESAPTEHVVPKRAYCQRCRHFADPPEVACTHEGTEIVELVDADHFRVRSCPMVGVESREFE